jgi:putative membrane protein insertion efficiency factor
MNHYKVYRIFLFLTLLFFTTSCSTGNKKIRQNKLPIYQSGIAIEEKDEGNFFKVSLSPVFKFYDKFISPIDNRKCIFTPTCSAYSRQAIKKYGFLRGYVLTFARITRCNHSVFIKNRYPRSKENDIWKAYDPVK